MFKKIYRSMNLISVITMVITAFLIMLACYITFNARLEEEVISEGQLLARFVEKSFDTDLLYEEMEKAHINKRITIISPDGTVVYENHSDEKPIDYLEMPEVKSALKDGEGYSRSFSTMHGATVFYYALQLDNGYILRLVDETHTIFTMFSGIIIPILIMALLIYLVCHFLAKNLTENIIRPINRIDLKTGDYTNVYDELVPFLKRISGQNKEIAHQVQKVKREELKLETISDNMSEGLIVLDKKSVILSANNSAAQALGVSKAALAGTDFDVLAVAQDIRDNISKALTGEKCHAASEINNKVYQIFYSPIIENRQVRGATILMFDISEEMRAEQIRREFSANVSHELKTPLTTILGYSQIINNGLVKPGDVENFTAKIEKEATRLITLIDDIIKLSRLDEASESDEKTDISIKEIVTEVIDSLAEKASERGITFSYDGGDFTILANSRQIAELVYNLCDNAVKYNKENGSVIIKAKDKVLTLSDTGIGIAPEHLDRIFERFYRVDKSRSKTVNGTGLGLSIVKHIALQNGGDVSVKSILGQGTVFTVRFN